MEDLSFLRPAFLLGLLGLSIPVIIHLLGRRQVRTVPFPAIRFLRRAQARATARWHLRRLLLLLSRLLVVASFAVLFSGPGCLKQSAGGEQPLSWIFVVDNSPSMLASDRQVTALDRARRQLNELVMEAREQDRFMLVTTERTATQGWSSGFYPDRSGLLAALSGLEIVYGDHDIALALERASGIATEIEESRIVLATDLQATAWQKVTLPEKTPVIDLLDVGLPSARNTWIDEIDRSENNLTITIGTSPGAMETDAPRIRLEGSRGKGETLRARNGTARFTIGPSRHQEVVHVALVDGGQIREDDVVDFPVSPDEEVNVLLVNGDPRGFVLRDEALFLRNALASETGALKKIRHREIRTPEIPLALNSPTDVVILANVGSISREAAEILRTARESGVGLVFTSGSNWKALAATGKSLSPEEEAFQSLLPLPVRDQVNVPVGDPLRPPFQRVDLTTLSGPFSLFARPESGTISGVQVRAYWVFETRTDTSLEIWMLLENGAPLLFSHRMGKGRSLVLATSIDRDEGNLCLQPVFLPFIHRLIMAAADRLRPEIPSQWSAGTPLDLDFPWPVTVVGPDESRSFLDAGPSRFVPPSPGLYRILRGEDEEGVLSARFPRQESDLTRLSPVQLENYLGAERFSLAGAGAPTLARQYRARSDASPLLAGILLMGILAEAFLSSRWKRKTTDVLWERPL